MRYSFRQPNPLSRRMFGVVVAAFLLMFAVTLSSQAITAAEPITPSLVKPTIAEAAPPVHGQDNAENIKQRWWLGGLMVVLLAIAGWYLRSHRNSSDAQK